MNLYIKKIKEKRPDILTFMGGANCFRYVGLRRLKTFDCLDDVFFGESDGIIAQVMKDIMKEYYDVLEEGTRQLGQEVTKEGNDEENK